MQSLLHIRGIFLFLLLLNLWCYAQQDSLEQQLSKCTNDNCRLKVYKSIGEQYFLEGNYKKSLQAYNSSLDIAKNLDYTGEIADGLYNVGLLYNRMNNSAAALNNLNSALDVGSNAISPSDKGKIYIEIATAKLALGQYEVAYNYQLDALKLQENAHDSVGIAQSLYGLGSIFFHQEAYHNALDYYQQALSAYQKINDKWSIYACLGAVGSTFRRLNDRNSLVYNIQALNLANEIGYTGGIGYSSLNAGDDYLSLGKPKKAIEYYNEALVIAHKLQDNQLEARILQSLGTAALNQHKPYEALPYLNQSLHLARLLKDKMLIKELYLNISIAHEENKNFEEAYINQKKYIALKDSLINQTTADKIKDLRLQYESQKLAKEKEMELRNKDRLIRRIATVFFVVVIILSLGLLWSTLMRYRSSTSANKLLEQKNEEIKLQNEQLAISNRDLEQFAYIASHDLREPLRIIGNYTDLINRRYRAVLDNDAQEYLYFISGAVMRLNNLLSDLLNYSRIGRQAQQPENIDLNEIVDIIVATFKPFIEDLHASVEVPSPLPVIKGNRSQMIQLFQNLIGNALKFRGKNKPKIIIDCQKIGTEYQIIVQDNGIGIEKEYLAHIFVIFKRLHSRQEYEGSGIGLAICKKIVEQHKGRIWVESEYGQGSTFYINLPISVNEFAVVESNG